MSVEEASNMGKRTWQAAGMRPCPGKRTDPLDLGKPCVPWTFRVQGADSTNKPQEEYSELPVLG